MRVRALGRMSAVVLLAAALAAFEQGRPVPGDTQQAVALDDIRGVIASIAGYSKDAIELLASPVHLRVSISDDKLAQSNQMGRENAPPIRSSSLCRSSQG